jgi:lipopolysaccharide export system protein LptC
MGFNKPLGQTLLIILLAIASYQLLHVSDHKSATPTPNTKHQTSRPSAAINNGTFIIYDKNGRPTHFTSKKALYFSNPKRILIDTPFISFTTNTNQEITLNAREGTFHPDEEKLFLKGGVIIKQHPSSTNQNTTHSSTAPPSVTPKEFGLWTLESEEFELNNQSYFISTDQAVTMTDGKSSIRAIGLNAWIDEKKIELLSEVQGRYVFNQ